MSKISMLPKPLVDEGGARVHYEAWKHTNFRHWARPCPNKCFSVPCTTASFHGMNRNSRGTVPKRLFAARRTQYKNRGAHSGEEKREYRVPTDLMNADPRFLKLGYLYRLTTALSE